MPEWITRYWVEWVFGLLIAVLTFVVRTLSARIKRQATENQALRDGMKSLLMRQIQMDCESSITAGYCTVETKKSIEAMYSAYHALGGNDIITSLRNTTMQLPTQRRDNHD